MAIIIDDNENCCLLLKEYLESIIGIDEIITDTDSGFLSELDNELFPAILFINFRIAERNGFKSLNFFKNKYPDTPVVALTAENIPERLEKIRKNNFDHILIKPIDFSKLENILSNI
ncbi:MAG: response regulator [Thiohalospira sp.]